MYKKSAFRRRLKQQLTVLNTVCPLQGRGNLPSVLEAGQLQGATLDQEILLSSRQALRDKNHPLLSLFSSHTSLECISLEPLYLL